MANGQELLARVNVIAPKVSTQVDKKVFQTLQKSLSDFVNNRRWTNDKFSVNEKIQCNIILTIDQDLGNK
jgi:hypothetical protein